MKKTVFLTLGILAIVLTPFFASATPESDLHRYLPTVEFDTAEASQETVQKITDAFRKLERSRPPERVSSIPAIRRIIIQETGTDLALRTFAGEYFRAWGHAYGSADPRPSEAILSIPKNFKDLSDFEQGQRLAKFLLTEFPRKLVPEADFDRVYAEWHQRVGHRAELERRFANYVTSNDIFRTEKIPVASIETILRAFDNLDPVRPPIGNNEPSDHQIAEVRFFEVVEGPALALKEVGRFGGGFDLFYAIPTRYHLQLTIPFSYRNPTANDMAELQSFLLAQMPKHEEAFVDLRRATNDWRKRMIASGHRKADPTLAGRAQVALKKATALTSKIASKAAEKIYPAPVVASALASDDFDRYLPTDTVNTNDVSNRTRELLLSAFERLEPLRPPAYGGIASREIRHINVVENGTEFSAIDSNIAMIPNAGLNGISVISDLTLTIPTSIAAMSDEDARSAMSKFLYKTFARKFVPSGVAEPLFVDWKQRMTSQGRLAERYRDDTTLTQKARAAIATPFLPTARRCEALFRPTFGF